MTIAADQIKQLRDMTGISVMACKSALEEAGGDLNKALALLSARGARIAEAKAERQTKAGIVEAYIHQNQQIGILLEIRSETDFVAKNEDFQKLAHNIAMHIAALNPQDIAELLGQQYIKNADLTIDAYLKEAIQKFGENIVIARFARFNI